MLRITFLEIKC